MTPATFCSTIEDLQMHGLSSSSKYPCLRRLRSLCTTTPRTVPRPQLCGSSRTSDRVSFSKYPVRNRVYDECPKRHSCVCSCICTRAVHSGLSDHRHLTGRNFGCSTVVFCDSGFFSRSFVVTLTFCSFSATQSSPRFLYWLVSGLPLSPESSRNTIIQLLSWYMMCSPTNPIFATGALSLPPEQHRAYRQYTDEFNIQRDTCVPTFQTYL